MKKLITTIAFLASIGIAQATPVDDLIAKGFTKAEVCTQQNMANPAAFDYKIIQQNQGLINAMPKATPAMQSDIIKSMQYLQNLRIFYKTNCLGEKV